MRKTTPQQLHGFHRLIHGQRGLANPYDLLRITHLNAINLMRPVHHLDVFGRLAIRAFHFLVAGVPDQQNVVILPRETNCLFVHLGDQRACCINRQELPRLGFAMNLRRDAMRRKDDSRTLGHLIGFRNENRPAAGEGFDDVLVVDDLLAHIHRSTVQFQRFFDGVDRPVNTRTIASRCGQENPAPIGRGLRGNTGRKSGRPRQRCGFTDGIDSAELVHRIIHTHPSRVIGVRLGYESGGTHFRSERRHACIPTSARHHFA